MSIIGTGLGELRYIDTTTIIRDTPAITIAKVESIYNTTTFLKKCIIKYNLIKKFNINFYIILKYMPSFNQTDFADPDIFERLRALSVVRTGHHIQTSIYELNLKQRRLANEWLNMYINKFLNCDNWMETLLSDFQTICDEELFDPKLSAKKDYTNTFVRQSCIEPKLIDKETDIRDTEYC